MEGWTRATFLDRDYSFSIIYMGWTFNSFMRISCAGKQFCFVLCIRRRKSISVNMQHLSTQNKLNCANQNFKKNFISETPQTCHEFFEMQSDFLTFKGSWKKITLRKSYDLTFDNVTLRK